LRKIGISLISLLKQIHEENEMSDPSEGAAPLRGRRDRSIAARLEARRKKAERQSRLIDQLNGGATIAELAAQEGVAERRIRMMVQEIIAKRGPKAPDAYAAVQVSRLNAAMNVAYPAMVGERSLKAVAEVVRIVHELDRFRGYAAAALLGPYDESELALGEPEDESSLTLTEAEEERLLALAESEEGRKRTAPQPIDNPRFAEGNGDLLARGPAVAEWLAPDDESDLALTEAEEERLLALAESEEGRKPTAPQPIDNARFAEGNGDLPARGPAVADWEASFETPASQAPQDEVGASSILALGRGGRKRTAPQPIDNARFAEGNGDLFRPSPSRRGLARAGRRKRSRACGGGKRTVPQPFENPRFAEGNGNVAAGR
jgi:hypothetical protein